MSTTTLDPQASAAAAVDALADAYRRTGDLRARDRLLLVLAPLVRAAGARDDAAAAAGVRALADAAEEHLPERDGPFLGFAWARVRASLG